MANPEDRIVSITFDNKNFEKNVAQTIETLDKLRASLDFSKSLDSFAQLNQIADQVDLSSVAASIDQINTAAGAVDLSGVAQGVDNISSKFNALGAIGFSVIQNLTNTVLNFGKNMLGVAKNDIFGPIITGGTKRAMNLEQAKFMFEGLGFDATKGLESAKAAVLGTAYGLDEAAKAAAQFGASGIKVGEEMTGVLRGVAGAAAMTGSSFTEIADIFAGSAGAGKVTNQDLLQFSTRGLNAAAAIAPILHTTEANIHEMATAGELDFQTFAKAMDQAFGKHATEANKTYSGSLANMHAALSRLGAAFETPKLEQQRDLFNAITPQIDKFKDAIMPVISALIDWRRVWVDSIVQTIGKANFSNFGIAMQKIGYAVRDVIFTFTQLWVALNTGFRDIFPKTGLSALVKFAEIIRVLAGHLVLQANDIERFRKIFAGLFAILDIGIHILTSFGRLIIDIFKALTPASKASSGGLLSFAASIGEALVKLDAFLVKGGKLDAFFKAIERIIVPPILAIRNLVAALFTLFNQVVDFDKIGAAIERPMAALKRFADTVANTLLKPIKSSPVRDEMDRIEHREGQAIAGLKNFADFLNRVRMFMGDAVKAILYYTKEIRERIIHLWGPQDFKPALDAANTGFFAVLLVMLYQLFNPRIFARIARIMGAGFQQFTTPFKNFMTSLSNTMNAFQKKIKVDTLMSIAKAIALLTISLIALATMDSTALSRSIAAVAGLMTILVTSLATLDKQVANSKSSKFQNSTTAKLFGLSSVLKAMAAAVVSLAFAIRLMAKIDPKELAAGLGAMLASMAMLVLVLRELNKQTKTKVAGVYMIQAAKAMLIISGAMIVLAAAIKIFSTMHWKVFGDGLAKIVLGLGLLVAALRLMPNNEHILAAATSIGILAFSLGIFAATIVEYNRIPWHTLIVGSIKVAIALGLIALAMRAFPDQGHLLAASAALIVVTFALFGIAKVLKTISEIKGGQLIGAVLAIAVVLGEMGIAIALFEGALPGAAAMVVAAGALILFAKAVSILGSLGVGALVAGLIGFTVVITVLVVALTALTAIGPELAILGSAFDLLGAAVLFFGGGIFLLALGLSVLSRTGVKGAEALAKVVESLVIIGISLVKALGNILGEILTQLYKLSEKAAKVAVHFMFAIIEAIIGEIPKFVTLGVEAFVKLVEGFLRYRNIFANAFITLIYGLADTIHKKSGAVWTAIGALALSFLDAFLGNVLEHAPGPVGDFFNKLFGNIHDKADKALSGSPNLASLVTDSLSSGLANDQSGKNSADNWTSGIMDTLTKSLGNFSADSLNLGDINPTVTPVMDLTEVTKGMGDMNTMFANNQPTIDPNISSGFASQLSAITNPVQVTDSSNATTPTQVNYTQNNYSPQALSTNDIYKQTKSQLALTKEDIGLTPTSP